MPVYAGAGAIGTCETITLARRLIGAGADVLSVITPYFAAASQEELYRHFAAVAESVDVPIPLYNIPARTNVNLNPSTVARRAAIENIVGVKDSSGNFDNILQYLELTDRDTFAVLSGTDSLILANLQAGGAGGITAIANIYPHTMVEIFEQWLAGDLDTARAAQARIRHIRNLFRHGNPNTIVKAATNAAGEPVAHAGHRSTTSASRHSPTSRPPLQRTTPAACDEHLSASNFPSFQRIGDSTAPGSAGFRSCP